MTAITVNPGYAVFFDGAGDPLDAGYVYIGLENQDAITATRQVYWDPGFTIIASQPLRTSGGYIVNNGTPANVYVGSGYSIIVKDKNLSTVYSAPSAIVTNVINNVEEITQYQGAHAFDPEARNDGTALEVGDLYYNSVDLYLKIWTGTDWVSSTINYGGNGVTTNTAYGYDALTSNTSGAYNVGVGFQAGYSIDSGNFNIFLGRQSGFYQTTLSNLLIIDNQARGSAGSPTNSTHSILYGVMAATPASQTLAINAVTSMPQGSTTGDGTNKTDVSSTGVITMAGTARINWTKITAASITKGTGTHSGTTGDTTGFVADLDTAHDGNIYHIDEVAAGLGVQIHFTGVTAFNWVQCLCNYKGAVSHAVFVQAYNWVTTTYDSFKIVPCAFYEAGAGINTIGDCGFFVPDDTAYIGTGANAGKVDIQVLHSTSGNSSHDLDIDCVALYQ